MGGDAIDPQYTLSISFLLVAAVLSGAAALYAWRRRAVPGASVFSWMMLAVAEWCACRILHLLGVGYAAGLAWERAAYLGAFAVPSLYLAFVLARSDSTRWSALRRWSAILAVEPVGFFIFVSVQGPPSLAWADAGPVVWAHSAYSYLLLSLSSMALVREISRSPPLDRERSWALLAGLLMPWLGVALDVLGVSGYAPDPVPIGFAAAGPMIAWALFHAHMPRGAAGTRDIMESLSDGVLVLDMEGRVTNLNSAAQQILHRSPGDVIGKPIEETLDCEPEVIERYRGEVEARPGGVFREEFVFGGSTAAGPRAREAGQVGFAPDSVPTERRYGLQVSPLRDRRGRPCGRLAVLRDITRRRRAEEALRTQKQLLKGLVAVARDTADRPTLDATLHNVLTAAVALTGAEYGTLFLVGEDGAVVRSLLVRGREALEQRHDVVSRVMEEGLAGWVALHRESALVHDTLHDERWLHLPESPTPVRSALGLPISSGSLLIGVLTLTHFQPGHFTDDQTYLMQAAAGQIALALHNARVFDMEHRVAQRQTALYYVLRAATGELTPEAVARAAVDSIVQFADWPHAVIALPNQERTRWAVQAAGGALADSVGSEFPIERGTVGLVLRTGQTQHIPDVAVVPEHTPLHPSVRCELAAPLRRGERVLGVLGLASEQPRAFDDDDILLTELLAEAIALAMDNARLYVEARRHVSDLDTLYTVARMVGQSLALEDVLVRALSSVLLSLGFDAGLIALVDHADDGLHVVAEHGMPSVLLRRWQTEGLEGTICAHVHELSEISAITDARLDPSDELRDVLTSLANSGLRGYAGIPLLHHEQSLGTLSLFTHRPRSFSSSEMRLLESIGRQVATAVANARLFEETVNERQRLLTSIESSRDGIMIIGVDQRVLVVNAPALRLLRLEGEPSDWTDRPFEETLVVLEQHAPLAASDIRSDVARIRTGDELPGEGECEVFPGTIRWHNLPVVSMTSLLGRMLVLRDVTEERVLARVREDLTHTMVHDLRNPLTGISIALQLLDIKLADVLTPAQHRLLEVADISTQKMVDLVNAILDVSRLEGRRMPLDRHPVSVAHLVAETLRLQLPLLTDRDLDLVSDVPPALCPVLVDAEMIGRVLQNLVGNAIKFTPAGGVIKITARHSEDAPCPLPDLGIDGSPYVWVSVVDTGPGISRELKGRLFEKFVVGDQAARGSGLGLAFCKLAIEAHDGHIGVDGAPGAGSMFVFTLPVAQRHRAQGT